MLPDVFMTITAAVGLLALFVLMLLPTLFEIRKPCDSGPRLIMPKFSLMSESQRKTVLFIDIEERVELNSMFMPLPVLSEFGSLLPSLEL